MELSEYLADVDLPSSDQDKRQYHRYYVGEALVGFGLAAGIGLGCTALAVPALFFIADLGVRLRRDAYRTTPTSGLIGLVREYI